MPDFNLNHILRGSGGMAWWNGKKLATLQSVEAKISGEFEDIAVCGDPATYQMYNGYSGDGTLVYLKVDSEIWAQLAAAFASGEMPAITIITALTQTGTNKTERVALHQVSVTELMLAKFEKKAKVEESVPFKFGKFEVLETI